MASQHTLMHGLLVAALVASAGLCTPHAKARSTGHHAGDGISRTLPPLRGEQPRGSDFFEDFDSYTVGSNVHGQNGWKGWANDPNAGAFVDDAFSSSPSNSLNVTATSDVVHEFDQASGAWVVRAMQYIPTGFTGQSYFIMQNVYNDAGTNLNWSVQVQFDSATGNLINDGGASGGSLPFVTDQWVPIRVEIDLDADTQSFYYNDQLLYAGTWTEEVSGAGTAEIGAIDLFANGASPVYYDDISITQAVDFAVTLDAPASGTTPPGMVVVYPVTIENTGLTDDTYDITAVPTSGSWTVTPSVTTIVVPAGGSATFDVGHGAPISAELGDSDVMTVIATSQGDPLVQATATITTTVALGDLIFADGFELPAP